jgi:hypothetical protein
MAGGGRSRPGRRPRARRRASPTRAAPATTAGPYSLTAAAARTPSGSRSRNDKHKGLASCDPMPARSDERAGMSFGASSVGWLPLAGARPTWRAGIGGFSPLLSFPLSPQRPSFIEATPAQFLVVAVVDSDLREGARGTATAFLLRGTAMGFFLPQRTQRTQRNCNCQKLFQKLSQLTFLCVLCALCGKNAVVFLTEMTMLSAVYRM